MNKYNKNLKHGHGGGHDNKNLIIAVTVSVFILMAFHFFYERPRLEQLRQAQMLQEQALSGASAVEREVGTETAKPANGESFSTKRVRIDTESLKGSIALTGARIDNLLLKNYHATQKSKDNVVLLSAVDTDNPYFGHFGWLSADAGIAVPDLRTSWQADNTKLGTEKPVTLTWNNPQGFQFTQEISIDDKYLFTVKKKIRNTSGKEATFYPYGFISREGIPADYKGFFILHEGPIGYIDGSLIEEDYTDVRKAKTITKTEDDKGWIGFTDKYWLTALMPAATGQKEMRFVHTSKDNKDRYQVDYKGSAMTIQAGEEIEVVTYFFAGAKELNVLERYEDMLGFPHLDLAIDFGWFYFITKPFFHFISFLYSLVGNFGVAIIIFTIVLRLALFPLSNKAFKSMARMRKITPQLEKLKEKHKGDRTKLQQAIMELYQKEEVNPLSGCFPILIQIPIFFALYKVLYVTIEMRHAPFWGWITDLSQPDPLNVFNLFGLIPWNPPSFLAIGLWPIIMGLTFYIQQKLNPKPQDPIQAKVMAFFPVFLTYILAAFPAGLVIYWSFSNIFAIAQQWVITRRIEKEK